MHNLLFFVHQQTIFFALLLEGCGEKIFDSQINILFFLSLVTITIIGFLRLAYE